MRINDETNKLAEKLNMTLVDKNGQLAFEILNGQEESKKVFELQSMILMKLNLDAKEEFNVEEWDQVVVTVPAYFFEPAKAATKEAASLARLGSNIVLKTEPEGKNYWKQCLFLFYD